MAELPLCPHPQVVFLPGAGGDRGFWRPVADRLSSDRQTVLLNWPGAGREHHDPAISSPETLSAWAAAWFTGPADLVAQSMGGAIAVRLALSRPAQIRRLVLVATSAGVDVEALGAQDWRPEYRRTFPEAAGWIVDDRSDLTDSVRQLTLPTLLIWGDDDPVSPVAVGEHLAHLLPDAVLHVVAGGTHSLAVDRPDAVAGLIRAHLD